MPIHKKASKEPMAPLEVKEAPQQLSFTDNRPETAGLLQLQEMADMYTSDQMSNTKDLEKEADVMGAKALQLRENKERHVDTTNTSKPTSSSAPIQRFTNDVLAGRDLANAVLPSGKGVAFVNGYVTRLIGLINAFETLENDILQFTKLKLIKSQNFNRVLIT